jgi:lysophospholipase L1-like esterase
VIDRATFVRSLTAAAALPAPPAQRSFNVLILGDSIAWGQGLKPEHRWRTLLIDRLGEVLKREVREISGEIHSGATIGIGDYNQIGDPGLYQPGKREKSYLDKGPYGGEIPSATPTVLAQLDALDASPDKDAPIDLVVISAGINDVRVTRLLDPYARDRFIADLIQLHCRLHLTALLDRVRTRCVERNPACRVAVLSYFEMVSADSTDFPSLRDFIAALLSQPPHTRAEARRKSELQGVAEATQAVNPPKPYASFADLPDVAKRMIEAAQRFYAESEKAIGQAVDDANRPPFSQAFVHVTPRIALDQAVFVTPGPSALWAVRFTDGSILPLDEVAALRQPLCLEIYSPEHDNASLNECRIASLGHPNVAGAQRGYFEALWDAIASLVR